MWPFLLKNYLPGTNTLAYFAKPSVRKETVLDLRMLLFKHETSGKAKNSTLGRAARAQW